MGEKWFWTYVTDALGNSNVCYVGQVIDNGHNQLVEVPKETYETCEELEYSTVVPSIK